MRQEVVRVDHFGTYACRNLYHQVQRAKKRACYSERHRHCRGPTGGRDHDQRPVQIGTAPPIRPPSCGLSATGRAASSTWCSVRPITRLTATTSTSIWVTGVRADRRPCSERPSAPHRSYREAPRVFLQSKLLVGPYAALDELHFRQPAVVSASRRPADALERGNRPSRRARCGSLTGFQYLLQHVLERVGRDAKVTESRHRRRGNIVHPHEINLVSCHRRTR